VAPTVETSSAEVSLGRGRRRWPVPAAVAAVALLIVAVEMVGGGTSDPAVAPTTAPGPTTTVAPSTTSVPPSTTAAPTTSTTTYSRYAAAPLPAAAGVVVYESTNEGDVLRIDLGSGDVQRRSAPVAQRVAGPWSVIGRQGGYVLSDGSYDEQSPVYGVLDGADGAAVPIVTWSSVENYGTIAPRAMAAAEPDEVWAWNDSNSGEPVTMKRVRLDGTVTAGPVALSRYGTVFGADGPGAILLQGAGGLYRAVIDGQSVAVERVSTTIPLAYSSGAFLQVDCDDALQCHLAVVDRATGKARVVPGDVIDRVVPSYDNTLSADGRWLVNASYESDPQAKLDVYDLTTGELVMQDDVMPRAYGLLGTPQSAEFTADGQWLVYFNLSAGIRLWKVGSTDKPLTFDVPVTNSNMISLAPA
jgi:hypothetical protein